MNKLTWRLRFARWLVRDSGYDLYRADAVNNAWSVALALQEFAQTSGHLTRAYHAGVRVAGYAKKLIFFLGGAYVETSR